MNILMLNWRDLRNPEAGGAELHMHEIGSRWARQGHEITLLCGGFSGGRSREDADGIDVHRVGNKYAIYFQVPKYLSSSKFMSAFDVVYESINTVPFFSPIFSRAPVAAQIYSIDNRLVLFQEFPLHKIGPMMGAFAASSVIPALYKKCNVATISRYSKRRLVEEGFQADQVQVAYPGVSDGFRHLVEEAPEVERPNSTLVYLGRLKRYKGIEDLILAMPAVRKKIPLARLLVVGKGEYEGTLRALASQLGIGNAVEFCGFLPEEKKAALLKSASLFLCTSKDEGGWTISAVEAMSAGVPILVTSSQMDVVEEGLNGHLLSSTEPDAIARAALSILEDSSVWSRYSANAKEFSGRFSWDSTARTTMLALKRAAG